MTGWSFLLLLPILIPCFFACVSLVIVYREKKLVWELAPMQPPDSGDIPGASISAPLPAANTEPYRPPSTQISELPVTPFAMQHGSALVQLGYTFLDSYRHVKGGIYQIRYDLLLSPDRLILASVESGSLSAIPVNNVTMISLGTRKNARETVYRQDMPFAIISMTNESCFEADLTGMVEQRHFPAAVPAEQDRLHRRRFATINVQPFSDSPLEDYRRFRTQHANAAEQKGVVYFLADDPNAQRPSLSGGFAMVLQMYGFMLGRRIYPHRWRVKRLPEMSA